MAIAIAELERSPMPHLHHSRKPHQSQVDGLYNSILYSLIKHRLPCLIRPIPQGLQGTVHRFLAGGVRVGVDRGQSDGGVGKAEEKGDRHRRNTAKQRPELKWNTRHTRQYMGE